MLMSDVYSLIYIYREVLDPLEVVFLKKLEAAQLLIKSYSSSKYSTI